MDYGRPKIHGCSMLFIIAPFIWWPLALWYPSLDPGVQFSHESWSCGLSKWQFLGYTAFLNEPFPQKMNGPLLRKVWVSLYRDIHKNPCKESNRWKRTLPLVLVVVLVFLNHFPGGLHPQTMHQQFVPTKSIQSARIHPKDSEPAGLLAQQEELLQAEAVCREL